MQNNSAVLIVVDAQNGFVREESAHVIPIIVDLVARWQAAGGEVIFTRYLNYPGSNFEKLFNWSKLMASAEIDIVPQLEPYVAKATAVVDKSMYSLFITPWLIADAAASHAGQPAHDAGILIAARFIGPDQIIKTAQIPSALLPGEVCRQQC